MNARTQDVSPRSWSATVLRSVTRASLRPVFDPRLPLMLQRAAIAGGSRLFPRPAGVQDVEHFLDGVLGRRLIPERAPLGRAVLYLHGGGYVLGSPQTHAGLVGRLAQAAESEVFVIDYRLAPEHPAPAALDDALAAWKALTQTHAAVAIAGDSAGGGLALALALAVRDAQLVAPRALGLISPWVDLTLDGESMRAGAVRDPLLSREWLAWAAGQYAADCGPDDPRVSPLFATHEGLPPVLIHAGADEVLRSDTERLDVALRRARVPVETCIHADLWHDFQLYAGLLPEADDSIEAIGRFLRQALDR